MKKLYCGREDISLRLLFVIVVFAAGCVITSHAQRSENCLRVLFWNIQNGMWSGQGDHYDTFVEWVKDKQPDVCVWCEAQSIYKTGTADDMEAADRYLIKNWGELAARYGHKYWYVGGHRDNYPQVITSIYPIENVARIIGEEPDSVVTHGAGWARINYKGEEINFVSLHPWPQGYAYRVEDRETSRAEHGGDRYRRMEMEYICQHTIESVPGAEKQAWIMMGDFNSRSRLDNWFYKYPKDDSRLLVHDYILKNTPYVDIIAKKYPGEFKTTTKGESRIDYMYCTPILYDRVTNARILRDDYTEPIRDPKELSNFYHPSDHLPILVDFNM